MSWEFTRPLPLFLHYIEILFLIIVSRSENIIFYSMLYSMYMNAGVISLFYPIMAFGFGLLEELRPKKSFWNAVRIYTTFLLLIKFIFSLKIMQD